MKLIKKFVHHLRTKGVIYTFIRTWEYILYKLRERKSKFRPITVKENDLWLVSNPKGVKFGYGGKELTVNVGLHTSVKCIEKLHDSTQADWEFEEINQKLIAKQRWWNLPMHQIWYITLSKNKISWTVILNVENIMILEEIKAGILTNGDYKNITINGKRYQFPESYNWELLGGWQDKNSLILQGNSSIPDIRFEVRKSLFPISLIAQNTDNHLRGRLVQIGIFTPVELPAGKYELVELRMELLY